MNLNIALTFSTFSGILIFLGGMLTLPAIGGAFTGVPTFSLPPIPIPSISPSPYASHMITSIPVTISSLIEISPPDNLAIITNSHGFILVISGFAIFSLSVILCLYYGKNEEENKPIRKIVPYRAPLLKEIIIKPVVPAPPAPLAPLAPLAPNAIIHELRPQTQAPWLPYPPYPPRGPICQRTFKYPPPYDAFNKK